MEVCANVDEACRLCLNGKGKISIFENGNTNLSITPENIFNCVSVKITKDDLLPKGICENCILNVENWCSFKTTCDKTQETLNDWLNCDRLNADFKKEEINNSKLPLVNGDSVKPCELDYPNEISIPSASHLLKNNVVDSVTCTESSKTVENVPFDFECSTSEDRTQEITSTLLGEEENKQSSVVSSTKEIEQDTVCSSPTNDSSLINNSESHKISEDLVTESDRILINDVPTNGDVENDGRSNSVEPMEVSSNTVDETNGLNVIIPKISDNLSTETMENSSVTPNAIEVAATSSVYSSVLPDDQENTTGITYAGSSGDSGTLVSLSRNESIQNPELHTCLDVRLDDSSSISEGQSVDKVLRPIVTDGLKGSGGEDSCSILLNDGALPDTTVVATPKETEVPKNDSSLDSDKENSTPNSVAPVPDSSDEKQNKVTESSEEKHSQVTESSEEKQSNVTESSEEKQSKVTESSEEKKGKVTETNEEKQSKVTESSEEKQGKLTESNEEKQSKVTESSEEKQSKVTESSEEKLGKATESNEEKQSKVTESSEERQSKIGESSEQAVESEQQHSFSEIRIESISTLTLESSDFFSSQDGKQNAENNTVAEKAEKNVVSNANEYSGTEGSAAKSKDSEETVSIEESSKETDDSIEQSNFPSSDQESVMEVDRSETDIHEQSEHPNRPETGRESQFSQVLVQNIKVEPVDTHETPSCNTNEMYPIRVKSEFSSFDYDDDVPSEYSLNDPSISGEETNKCDICNRKYSSLSNYLKHLQTKVHIYNASLGPEGNRPVSSEAPESSYMIDSRVNYSIDSFSEDSRLSSYSNDSPMLRSRLCPEEFIPPSPNRFHSGAIRQAKPRVPYPSSLSKLPKRKEKCKLCNTTFTYISEMRRHLLSKKHKENERLMRDNDRLMRENDRMIRDSERMMREKERYMRERALMYPKKEEVLVQPEKSQHPFICPIENCHYSCLKGTRLLDHMKSHGIGQPATPSIQFAKDLDTQTPRPKLSLRQQELLKKELEKKKTNAMLESPVMEPLSYDYKCDGCGKTFMRESGLKKHGYYCSAVIAEQQQEIEEQPKISDENNTDNLRLKKMHCPICNLTFAAKSVFISHVQIYHKGSTLESGLFRPKKTVITSNKLRVKSKKGHSYVCNHCGKKFNLLSSLNFHLKVHSTKHICKICKKGYDSRRAFMDHCRLHFLPPGSKQTLCHKCFRVFKTRGEFYHHRKNDMCSIKLKIYSCNICQHSFKDPSALEEHKVRFHNDILDASDDEINTSRDRGSSMPNYLPLNQQNYDAGNESRPGPSTKTHSSNINQSNQPKTDPFLHCDVCDRDYATLASLKKHMWKYHQTKPMLTRRLDLRRNNVLQAGLSKCWKCRHCKKICNTRRMLVVHLKKCKYNAFELEDGMCLQCGKWCESGKSRICRFCLPDISKIPKSKKNFPESSNYLVTPKGEYSMISKQEFNTAPARIPNYNYPGTIPKSKTPVVGGGIRLMKCPVGNKYFRSELLMIKHYSQCDGSCENRCSHCRKLFNSPKEYRVHLWNSNCYGANRTRSKGSRLDLKALNSFSESDFSEIESLPAKQNDDLEISSEISGVDSSMLEENSVLDMESGFSNDPSDKIIEEKSIKMGRVCTICNKVITMQRAVYRHVYGCFKIYMLTQESVSCKKCNRTFSKHMSMKENTSAIRQHILDCHFIPYYEGEGVTEDGGFCEEPPPLLCYVCSFGFSSNESLKRHIMEHRSRKDEINNLVLLLEAELLSERRLNSDSVSHHIQIQPESCETLTSQPVRKRNMLSFKVPGSQNFISRKIIRKKLLECEKCNRKFTNRNKFLRHKKVHGIVTQSVFHEVSENYLDFITDHTPPSAN